MAIFSFRNSACDLWRCGAVTVYACVAHCVHRLSFRQGLINASRKVYVWTVLLPSVIMAAMLVALSMLATSQHAQIVVIAVALCVLAAVDVWMFTASFLWGLALLYVQVPLCVVLALVAIRVLFEARVHRRMRPAQAGHGLATGKANGQSGSGGDGIGSRRTIDDGTDSADDDGHSDSGNRRPVRPTSDAGGLAEAAMQFVALCWSAASMVTDVIVKVFGMLVSFAASATAHRRGEARRDVRRR